VCHEAIESLPARCVGGMPPGLSGAGPLSRGRLVGRSPCVVVRTAATVQGPAATKDSLALLR
jgi:hypothetical protein